MAAVDRAIVVGGGLAGLSAAIHLRRVGIDAHVYDKYDRLSGGEGTVISIFPNGCRALQRGDPSILPKMKAKGKTDLVSFTVTPNGDRLAEWKLGSQMEKRYGQPLIAILWQDALRILWDSLPEDCKHVGYECYDVTQSEEGADVHFKKGLGTFTIKAPLVVGADGIHSTVRKVLFSDIRPRDNGRRMWRAIIERNAVTHEALFDGNLASMQCGRTMFIINGIQGKLYWCLSITDEITDGDAKIPSRNMVEAKERLLKYFEGWELAVCAIQATDPDLILERRVLDMPVLPKWSSGKVVLLGDAVHAVTPSYGQGANLAFEDGLELAKQFTKASDLRIAFEEYEKARMPRATVISEKSQHMMRADDEFYDWLYTYDPEVNHGLRL